MSKLLQNQLSVEVIDLLDNYQYELGKIKGKAMDANLDELASEINAIQNGLEVDARKIKKLIK